jgi:hypothetical protein
MFPLNYALAVALLTSPVDEPDRPPPMPELATLRPTLQQVALAWELMDPREVHRTFALAEDLPTDVRVIQRRWLELADAPPLQDCMRFPDRRLVHDLLDFNRAYRQQLEARYGVEVTYRWDLHEAIQETERLFKIWDLVRDSRCELYYVNFRRGALKRLRDSIGDTAYITGELPPHVPIWRFGRID